MSVVILGGNECMEQQYSNTCRKYGCKAKVRCFMEDSRRGVKCTGCWKAYGNEEEAQMTFRKYRKCTDVYRREFSKGRSLLQLMVRTGRLCGRDANIVRKD